MFGWFKKKQTQEHIKLLFQNKPASESLASLFDVTSDPAQAARMRAFETENRRIALSEAISANDQKTLLEMNGELRRFFIIAETTGPEARVRHAMGQPPLRRDFDEKYKPIE